MVILSSCLTIILICTKSRLWLDLCMHTGWLKKVSCCTVSTAYFFEPPCISNRLVLVVLLSCVFLLLCFLCFHCYCMCLLICVCRILIKITYLLTYFTDIIHGYTWYPEQLEQVICTMTLRLFFALKLNWQIGNVMRVECAKCGSWGERASTLRFWQDGEQLGQKLGHRGQLPPCSPLATPIQQLRLVYIQLNADHPRPCSIIRRLM